MKILFGIQGTGNGHISRARVLAKYLAQQPLTVDYLISGRKKEQLFNMDAFGDFQHRTGLTFATRDGKIDYLATAKNNQLLNFFREINSLDLASYDLIISDFEPVTAWAGKRANKTVLGIGHQYAFGKNTPLAGDSWLSRMIMRNFAPTTLSMGLHWHPYDQSILPPIIDTKLTVKNPSDHIVVYLPFECQEQVCQLLTHFPEQKFKLYSPELTDGERGNISLRKTSYLPFKADLASAKRVICNSGFELISECLHLGLPILTKPLNGQMEQHSNALALKQLKYAKVVTHLEVDGIKQWLAQKFNQESKPLPNVAKALAQWIAAGRWQDHQALANQLWQETDTNGKKN